MKRFPAAMVLSVCSMCLVPVSSYAGDPPASTPSHDAPRDTSHYNLEKNKPAIKGYDPVAYFPQGGGKPTKGKKDFAHTHRGVTYWFASAENLAAFKADPDAFEPEYGGWCATAMADGGRKVEIDPKNFKITGGRLFLFYKDVFSNALTDWNKNETGNTTSADGQWQKLTGEKPASN